MKDKKSNDLILAYLTPDLFGISKEYGTTHYIMETK
jgi:hypothetical protein